VLGEKPPTCASFAVGTGATGNSVAQHAFPVCADRACARIRTRVRARARDARTRDSAYTPNTCCATANGVAPAAPAPPASVTVLRHCRCIDCRKFSQDAAGEYFCEDRIGGVAIVWPTGRRICEPPPDAWHYCAGYDGPQISKDVFVWPRGTRRAAQVGAGSTISPEVEPEAVPSGSKRDTCTSPNVSRAANGSFAGTYSGRPRRERSA